MELDLPVIELEKSQDFVKQSFDIGDTAVILNILRSKMYSTPIKTICQEYMSNARDAHREVSNPNPIQIELPDSFNQQWTCRDFGPGISPERMANVFVRYGCSTKRTDNSQTGGFGLGAKSGFALSDTFTVETITPEDNKLVKRIYVAVIDPSQKGEMNLLSEEETQEPQGTKIIIPAESDYREFKQYTMEVAQYWDIKPEIVRGEIAWPSNTTLYTGEGWSFNWDYDAYNSPVVCIDGIQYPLKSGVIDDQTTLYRQCWVLFFKTGEIGVTSNREALDYSPKTIDLLKTRYESARQAVMSNLFIDIAKAPDLWQGKLLYHKFKTHCSKADKAMWNGIVVDDEAIKIPGTVIRYKNGLRRGINEDFRDYIIASDDTAVYFNDEGKAPNKNRIKTLLEQHRSVQVVTGFTGTTPVEIEASKTEAYKRVLSHIPMPMMTTVEKQAVYRNSYKQIVVRKFNEMGSDYAPSFRDTDITLKDLSAVANPIFTVIDPSNRKLCQVFNRCLDNSAMKQIVKFLDLKDLYVITPANKEKAEKYGWINVETLLIKEYEKLVASGFSFNDETEYSIDSKWGYYSSRVATKLKEVLAQASVDCIGYRYYMASESTKSARQKIGNIPVPERFKGKVTDTLQKLYEEFTEAYPLLAENSKFEKEEALWYVTTKDNARCYNIV